MAEEKKCTFDQLYERDVISRVNSEYLTQECFLQLRDYHDKGVDIALRHWSNLVDVAKELALALWKGITK